MPLSDLLFLPGYIAIKLGEGIESNTLMAALRQDAYDADDQKKSNYCVIFIQHFVNVIYYTIISGIFMLIMYAQYFMLHIHFEHLFGSNRYLNTLIGMGLIAAIIIILLTAILVLCTGYTLFLQMYISFSFTNSSIIEKYRMTNNSLCYSCFIPFMLLFCVWFIITVILSVHLSNEIMDIDVNDTKDMRNITNKTIKQLTSADSIEFWFVSIPLSPVFILCIVFIWICLFIICRNRNNFNSVVDIEHNKDENKQLERCLLAKTTDELMFSIQENGGRNSNDIQEDNKYFEINKCILYKLILVHILLFFSWIVWKWMTAPKIEIKDEGHILNIYRKNGIVLYWSLYLSTTIIKYTCYYILNIPSTLEKDKLICDLCNVKRNINVYVSIIFSFGLKFLFTNLDNDWNKFVFINTIHCTLNIFINGSFLSSLYGKKIINRIKLLLNKCICSTRMQLKILDLSNADEISIFNENLASKLCINFIISSSSCLIIMIYFAISMYSFNIDINYNIFFFMIISFGFECVVFFGQILTFNKNHRKYFIIAVYNRYDNQKFNCENKKHNVINFIGVTLLLSWFWIGNLTGCPVDFSST